MIGCGDFSFIKKKFLKPTNAAQFDERKQYLHNSISISQKQRSGVVAWHQWRTRFIPKGEETKCGHEVATIIPGKRNISHKKHAKFYQIWRFYLLFLRISMECCIRSVCQEIVQLIRLLQGSAAAFSWSNLTHKIGIVEKHE